MIRAAPRCSDFGTKRWRGQLGFDEAVANGEAHQIAETLEFHFVHDVIAVAFDRADGKANRRGDLLVAHAAGQHLQNFDFAGGKWRSGEGMLVGRLAFGWILDEGVYQ